MKNEQAPDLIPVGPPGSPASIGMAHRAYPEMEQPFHSYCSAHPNFGFCGNRESAEAKTVDHLAKAHSELLLTVVPADSLVISSADLAQEFEYRLRTMAALALMRGKHGEKLAPNTIEDEIKSAVRTLTSKSKGK